MFTKRLMHLLAACGFVFLFCDYSFSQEKTATPPVYQDEVDKNLQKQNVMEKNKKPTDEKQLKGEKEEMKEEVTPEEEIIKKAKEAEKQKKVLEEAKKIKKLLEQIRPFGYEFFDQSPTSFIPGKDVSPPSDYSLGPGDELKVVFFSPIGQQDVYPLKVDNEGNVYLPVAGKINVTGLTRGKLEVLILSRLQSHFPQLQGYVTLERLRTIRIFITGEAKRPGGYIVSGLSTAFNALYVAGGPNQRGSMRNIQLLRNNKLIATIDLYSYLLKGDRTSDIPLEPEDTLFIPVAKNRITVKGEVNRQAIYELKENEMSLDAALEMAGGLKPAGYSYRIQIERVQSNKDKIVLDVNLKDEKKALIQDGDSISVFPVADIQKNIVWIEGEVQHPGKYELKEGMTVAGLLAQAEGLKKLSEVYTDRGDIIRVTDGGELEIISFNVKKALSGDNEQDKKLMPFDTIKIYSVEDAIFVDRTVSIGGAIKNPGTYHRSANMTLQDLINIAGGLLPEAMKEVEVARAQGEKDGLIMKISLDGNDAEKTMLEDRDVVSIKTSGTYQRQLASVVLQGEVKYPGVYALRNDHETLYQILARAGGMDESSFPEGAILNRNLGNITTKGQSEVSQSIQKNLDFLVQQQYNVELAKHGVTPGKNAEEAATLPAFPVNAGDMQKLTQFTAGSQQLQTILGAPSELQTQKIKGILEPRKVTEIIPKERIIIDLMKLLKSNGKEGDVVLMDGDILFVPKKPLTVSVVGAVLNPGNIIFEQKKNIEDYILKVGGYAEDANKNRVIVLKANGETYARNKVKYVDRGDILIVPPKPLVITEKKSWWEKTTAVVKVISDTATAAFIIRSLKQLSTK